MTFAPSALVSMRPREPRRATGESLDARAGELASPIPRQDGWEETQDAVLGRSPRRATGESLDARAGELASPPVHVGWLVPLATLLFLTGVAGASELRVGLGIAPLPVIAQGPLAGYGGFRTRRANSVLDPPEARALVLEQDDRRIALVSLDLVIIRPGLRQKLRKALPDIDLSVLTLVATHTHSGPGGYMTGRLAALITAGPFQKGMTRAIVRSAQHAVRLALIDLAPARAQGGSTRLEMARNRRGTEGPRETALPFVRFTFSAPRDPIVLFSYGAHPTVLSRRSHAYSADYVGAARGWLESRHWRALFLPGPLGDQEPVSTLGQRWPHDLAKQQDQVSEIGTRLAAATYHAANALPPAESASDPELEFVESWSRLPRARLRRGCAIWWLAPFVRGSLESFLSRQVPIQAFRVGNTRLVALPAEPTSAVGQEVRERLGDGPLFVIAHANDWIGYVVRDSIYRSGGYEACLSFYGPAAADWLVDEVLRTAARLRPPLEETGGSGP